jgi:folate-dependent phosphoribosylglycinamide formyltransferase PurN
MHTSGRLPAVILICHQQDRLDSAGLASWLAATMRLVGIIEIAGDGARLRRAARRELARGGVLGFLDVLAMRAYSRLWLARTDTAWADAELARLRARYPVNLDAIPKRVVSDPNEEVARSFIARLQPDLIVARCKFILKPDVFTLARAGTFALHPGICPEYRNAHGCFWALANRDLDRVGMTLLKIDRGVDTGPALLQATCRFDEVGESHYVIQQRVVFDNLERIWHTLMAAGRGESPAPIDTAGRVSAVWGQPRLTSYLRWKRAARRDRRRAERVPAVS